MISQLELASRAALCRQLAQREPAYQALWLAEAESWSRLSREQPRSDICSSATFRNSGGGGGLIRSNPEAPWPKRKN